MISPNLQDGTWSTIQGCFTVVRDFKDICFNSYFSIMDELRNRGPPDAKYYELRFVLVFMGLCQFTTCASSAAFWIQQNALTLLLETVIALRI